jgi:hypothetical protein
MNTATKGAVMATKQKCINCERRTANWMNYGEGTYICVPCAKELDMARTWDVT